MSSLASTSCVDVCETKRNVISKVKVLKHIKECPSDPSWLVSRCTSHHPVCYQVKKDCKHDTSLTYACLDLEVQAAASHTAGEVVVEDLGDLDDAQGNPKSTIDYLCGCCQRPSHSQRNSSTTASPCSVQFNDVVSCEDLICASLLFPKACLFFLHCLSGTLSLTKSGHPPPSHPSNHL